MRFRMIAGFAVWMISISVVGFSASPVGFSVLPNDSELIEAVKDQNIGAVRALIDQHVDVNAPQPDGSTALAWASYRDDIEIAGLLIRSGADVDLANDLGVTPVTLACENRSESLVERLLQAGADPNIAQWNGQTPLMTCAWTGTLAAVKALLDRGAEVNSREAERGQTAIMAAAAGRHADVVDLLAEYGAEVNARTESGFTPLMFAAQQGDLDAARSLMARGADVHAVAAEHGNTLTVASAGGFEDVALYLLEQGAEASISDSDGITPLHFAMAQAMADIIGSAPTSAFNSPYKVRPSNMRRLAEALIARGANPNARIEKVMVTFGTTVGLHGPGVPSMVGATPFLLAAISGDVDLMRKLLSAGADAELRGAGGTTALLAATGGSWNGYRSEAEKARALEAVKLLVEMGADVNEANAEGQTPMHAAAYTGADAIIQFLVDQGAEVDPRSRARETPWSMAQGISPDPGHAALYAGHEGIADLLLDLGATAWTDADITSLRETRINRYGQPPANQGQ